MAKKIKQYRYYGNDTENSTISQEDLITGKVFETRISDLRIQAYPGTKFYLNDSDDWVMIGATGEYHLGLSGNYEIAFLRFDENSLKMNYGLNGEVASYVVIDIVYDTNEG